MHYSSPKGVFDILPAPGAEEEWKQSHLWQYVEKIIRTTAQEYGFKELRTPIFEQTSLFVKGVGTSSDIVTKEMYTFEDKGGRSLTLRPEGTAPAMRAYIEKHLEQYPSCQKLFYIGPMFRYERPQAGRFRQHHQFGAEAIGDETPFKDVEVIDLLLEVYRRLGLKQLRVKINSVGDEATRSSYRSALIDFLKPHLSSLSSDSQVRFEKNPLRILDSKDPEDQRLLIEAPTILDFLTPSSKEHFERVQRLLSDLKIDFQIETKLVRGLDYYNKTVFEITSGELGSQNSVGGGGRYDGLISSLGGPALPAVGFGTGLERVIQTMIGQRVALPPSHSPLLYIIPIGETAQNTGFQLAATLRKEHYSVEMDYRSKKVGQSLQTAEALKSKYVLVLGENELTSGLIKLKEMATRNEIDLRLDQLSNFLGNNHSAP